MKPDPSLGSISTAIVCGILAVTSAVGSRAQAQESPRTLVAIFAHPDDEQSVSPLLARYAREGAEVPLARISRAWRTSTAQPRASASGATMSMISASRSP